MLNSQQTQQNIMTNYRFSQINFNDLKKIANIKPKLNYEKFNNWFNSNDCKLNNDDTVFLENLIKRNIFFLDNYKEEDLKVKFITPILNRIDFVDIDKEVRDFYDEYLCYETDSYILSGEADFMVAKGYFFAEQPYFFIQEFKKAKTAADPEPQLLAELIAALELNQFNMIKGAFIVGAIWNFVILEKLDINKYQYFVSKNFDSTDLEKLKQIYKHLLVIKNEIFDYASAQQGD